MCGVSKLTILYLRMTSVYGHRKDKLVFGEDSLVTILTTPEQIRMAQLITWKHALKLEIKGMTRHGTSVYTLVKREFGFVGGKQRVYDQFCEYLFKLQQKELELDKRD